MVYDLSITLNEKTPVYETDPMLRIEKISDLAKHGFNVSSIYMSTHSGTHVDLPLHCISSGKDAAAVPLDALVGDAVIIEVPYIDDKIITLDDIDKSLVKEGDILLIRTGWEEKAGSGEFFTDFPYFDISVAQKLKKLGVKALGTDMPSVDRPGSNGEVHRAILGSGIFIIEALVNLRELVDKRCFFSAVPLKIENGDGSPVRAYAMIL